MIGYFRAQRHDLVDGGLGDLRLVAPVDDRVRQMEEDIDDARLALARADEPVEQLACLRPDAGERRSRCEERGEKVRAHRLE